MQGWRCPGQTFRCPRCGSRQQAAGSRQGQSSRQRGCSSGRCWVRCRRLAAVGAMLAVEHVRQLSASSLEWNAVGCRMDAADPKPQLLPECTLDACLHLHAGCCPPGPPPPARPSPAHPQPSLAAALGCGGYIIARLSSLFHEQARTWGFFALSTPSPRQAPLPRALPVTNSTACPARLRLLCRGTGF